MIGVVFAFLAAICWAAGAILVRWGLIHVKPSVGVSIATVASLIFTGGLTLVLEVPRMGSFELNTLWFFFIVGLLVYVFGRQALYLSISYVGAARATPIFACTPLVAITVAVLLMGETMNLVMFLGATVIVAGILLVMQSTEHQCDVKRS
jgi:drug/metabolite transporter (DMT)-like permease